MFNTHLIMYLHQKIMFIQLLYIIFSALINCAQIMKNLGTTGLNSKVLNVKLCLNKKVYNELYIFFYIWLLFKFFVVKIHKKNIFSNENLYFFMLFTTFTEIKALISETNRTTSLKAI